MVPHLLLTLMNTRIRSSYGSVSGAYSWRCLPSTPLSLKQIGLCTQPTSSSHVYQSLLCGPSARWAYRTLNLATRTSSSVNFVNAVTRVEIAMYGVSSSHIVPNARKNRLMAGLLNFVTSHRNANSIQTAAITVKTRDCWAKSFTAFTVTTSGRSCCRKEPL